MEVKFRQVSHGEFNAKCNSNQPFVLTIENGNRVYTYYRNNKVVGKVVEKRSSNRRLALIGISMLKSTTVDKSYFLSEN